MPTYGQTITWHEASGNRSSFTVEGCATPQEALSEAIRCAKSMGWTPPKWWQWWRWSEHIRADFQS
jgi:hypothetical protein